MTDDSKLLPVEPTPELNKEYQYIYDKLNEELNNKGNEINWHYWLNLPLWTAEEAIYLISLNNPNNRDEDKKFIKQFPKNSGVEGDIEKRNNIVTLAEREQQAGILCQVISPQMWVEWAMTKGYKIPSQLSELSEKLNQSEQHLKYGRDLFGLTITGEQYIIRHANGGSSTTNRGTYENLKVAFNQLLANGRYTLNDAALAIEEETNASAKDIVNKLCLAAEKGTLKMFDSNTGARWLYGERFNLRVKDFLEVTTYSELNKWLNEYEPLLNWRFPEPQSSDNRHEFTDKPVIADDVIDTRKKWEKPNTIEYKCRQLGVEYIQTQIDMPSVNNIAKYVEKKLKDENIVGKRGDYWDWQTIKKEALTGITGRKAKGKK